MMYSVQNDSQYDVCLNSILFKWNKWALLYLDWKTDTHKNKFLSDIFIFMYVALFQAVWEVARI